MTMVTVVVPTRNRSALLAMTLRSVLWQRGVDLEIVVVDDNSTDGTAEVVASFGDPRISLIHNAVPRGPGPARNRGVERARGEWLAFVDDDDLWAPDKLVYQLAAARRLGRDWAYAGVADIGDRCEILAYHSAPEPDEVLAAVARYNAIPGGGSNAIVRRQLFAQVGGFEEQLAICEDWELWIRLARCGPPAATNQPLVAYRLHGQNRSLELERILRDVRLIERLHGVRPDWGRLYRWFGESCLRSERHIEALGQFARAAVNGQAWGVGCDLAAIVKKHIARRIRTDCHQGTPVPQTGLDPCGWLLQLEGSFHASQAEP